ncbi:hypothetical protein [Paenibacillus glycanilyticus]|uniref:hypothetical protein n=1 Tax=Paenibacillus glycanilyticus TaxID=126569 RepID=UPI003DA24594
MGNFSVYGRGDGRYAYIRQTIRYLPIGLIAFVMIAFFYKESVEHSKQKIDYLGAITLVASIVSLMFALELGGKEYAWDSGMIIGLFGLFAVLFLAFVYIERRAEEPIIAFGMFKNRLYSTSNIMAIFSGAAFITASIYIPVFIQGVHSRCPWRIGYEFGACLASDDARLGYYCGRRRSIPCEIQVPFHHDSNNDAASYRHSTPDYSDGGYFTPHGHDLHDSRRSRHRFFVLRIKQCGNTRLHRTAARIREFDA